MDYAKEYGKLHETAGGKWFSGYTLKRYVGDVAKLVAQFEPRIMLDYGCGKGYQYLSLRLHEKWGGLLPYCYDVGVRQLTERPTKKFDAVISTDMLEHIEETDVPKILDDIFSFVTDEDRPVFVFLSITCNYAVEKKKHKDGSKTLPNGRDVHVTVKPPEWWKNVIREARQRRNLNSLTIGLGFELEDGRVIRETLL